MIFLVEIQPLNPALAQLIAQLQARIGQVNFDVFKTNYNLYLARDTHTRIIFDEDEDGYAATPFSLRELHGEETYLRNELNRQLNLTAAELSRAPFDDARKVSLFLDEYAALVQGLAITCGLNPQTFRKKLLTDALKTQT